MKKVVAKTGAKKHKSTPRSRSASAKVIHATIVGKPFTIKCVMNPLFVVVVVFVITEGYFVLATNAAVERLWTAEIISLIWMSIFTLLHYRYFRPATVGAVAATTIFGLYARYYGYYYPHYAANAQPAIETVWPQFVHANLWLAGGALGGYLLGKGLECADKRGFWLK